jgi:hypothetical protein
MKRGNMSDHEPGKRRQQQGESLESWAQRAERFGVSTKTLDRWAARGILDPPQLICGRKYGRADAIPRFDILEEEATASYPRRRPRKGD